MTPSWNSGSVGAVASSSQAATRRRAGRKATLNSAGALFIRIRVLLHERKLQCGIRTERSWTRAPISIQGSTDVAYVVLRMGPSLDGEPLQDTSHERKRAEHAGERIRGVDFVLEIDVPSVPDALQRLEESPERDRALSDDALAVDVREVGQILHVQVEESVPGIGRLLADLPAARTQIV